MARFFAVAMSQAPGLSGTPDSGHRSSAATSASCASSSAMPTSRTIRARPAMSRADSIRQTASIARCASVAVTLPITPRSSARASCDQPAICLRCRKRMARARRRLRVALLGVCECLRSILARGWPEWDLSYEVARQLRRHPYDLGAKSSGPKIWRTWSRPPSPARTSCEAP